MPSVARTVTIRQADGAKVERTHHEHFCEVCGEANAKFGDPRGWFCGWDGTNPICRHDAVAAKRELL